MNSALKRGEALRPAAYNYTRLFFLTRELLRGVPALRVYYERLAAAPRNGSFDGLAQPPVGRGAVPVARWRPP